MSRFPRPVLFLTFLLTALIARATIGVGLQMQLGNPSGATANPANHQRYLIDGRPQYALDYNNTTRQPNWVAWNLTTTDVGSAGRSSVFFVDTTLPAGFYQVQTTDYSGSGYDRGHMTPSGDRTVTRADNDATFFMSNMIPQAPDNNQGVWANFETYCRTLAAAGNEILIISGPSGFAGSTIASGVAIPGHTWKIAVVVPLGAGTALSRITASTRIITIKVPNIAGVRSTPWENFVTSVAQIEADTGYTFLTELPVPIATALRTVIDGVAPVGAPTIVAHPSPQTTVVGGSASFSVTATGDAPLSYQWFRGDDDIVGATGPTLILSNVQAADVGNYTVVVTNAIGSATSNPAALVVNGLPPVITTSPASQAISAGSSVTFTVSATGSPTLSYQWRKALAPIAGATTATFTLGNAQSADAGSYDVVVTNSVGSATSAAAFLTVNAAAPTITGQPISTSVNSGSNAGFTVVATGTAPLSYAWRKGGTPLVNGGAISGATTATLLLTGVSAANGGDYDVVVTNGLGTATSNPATLTVNPPPPSVVYWNFNTAEPTSGLGTEITGGAVSQGNNNGTTALLTTTSASSGYTGASGTNNAGAAARIGALNQGANGSAYFEFTLTPAPGKRLLATGISFGSRSTGTGPQAYGVYTSLDNYATPVATGALLANSAWALHTPTFASVTGATSASVTFRIYGYNGTGSPSTNIANWRIDDLKLTVTTIFPPPVPPEVTAATPANGATGVAIASPITVTFNEAVAFIGPWFTIHSALQGPIAAAVTGGPVTYTLTPPSFFANTDTIFVTILGAKVVDQATGTIPGTSNTSFSFTTEVFVPPTPPTVTAQPVSQSVNVGASPTFTVSASGTAPLSYQWRKNNVPIAGNPSASTATLALTGVTTADAGSYHCVVSNVAGSDVSQAATLTVTLVPPTITVSPVAQIAAVGGSASFSVGVSGTAPFTYQWRRNGAPLPGATAGALALSSLTHAESGAYDVVVTNGAGSVTSAAAILAVVDPAPTAISWDFATADPSSGVPPGVTGGTVAQGNNNGTTTLITSMSVSGSYTGASGGNNAGAAARTGVLNQGAGGSAYFEFTFTAPAGRQFAATGLSFGMRSTGTGPQAFALYSSADGFAAPLVTGAVPNNSAWSLYTPAFRGVTTTVGGAVTFRLFGYNGTGSPGAGTANWRIDDLKVTAGLLALPPVPPTITTPPLAQTVTVGDTVTLTVVASGTTPFSYQWRKGGIPITGNASATTASLLLPTVTTAAAGDYDCVVTNIAGTATSSSATLTVDKAVATVTFGGLAFIYNGSPQAATATTNPAGLPLTFTYNGGATAPTNAGSYAVVATVVDTNYVGTANGTLTIAPATATVALTGLGHTYDGTPKAATVTTVPAGLATTVTYDGSAALPTNAGSYAVVATVVDTNYSGAATGTLTIAPAAQTINFPALADRTFGAAPFSVTATASSGLPVSLSVFSGPASMAGNTVTLTGAGLVTLRATQPGNTNYLPAVAVERSFTVNQATATLTLAGLTHTYDGTPKAATATTTPAGLTVTFTYDGSPTAPVNPGAYAVVATIVDANYAGTASGTLTIGITAIARRAPDINGGLDGSLQVLTGESLSLNGNAWVSGDLLLPGTPSVRANGKPVLAGILDGTGSEAPAGYQVTLSGNAVLRYLVRRTDPLALPIVAAPPAPTGTRNVTLTSVGQSPGDFATLRNLTLSGNAGDVALPAGTYGALTASGNSSFTLGVAGSATPAVYHLQSLTLNAGTELRLAGPVVITLASGATVSGRAGSTLQPDWLTLQVAAGGVTLNGNATLHGRVVAPAGTVALNGSSTLTGSVVTDRLTIGGNAELRSAAP